MKCVSGLEESASWLEDMACFAASSWQPSVRCGLSSGDVVCVCTYATHAAGEAVVAVLMRTLLPFSSGCAE